MTPRSSLASSLWDISVKPSETRIIHTGARSTVQCCMSAVAVLEFHLLLPSGMQPQPSVVMLVQRLSTAAVRVTLALCWLEDLGVVMQIATC